MNMKKLMLLTLIFLTGCGAHYQASVYGRSGKLYQAPRPLRGSDEMPQRLRNFLFLREQ
jgi:hypothetical protein